ncbi:AEC family transporter [Pararhodobacter zhoushanensis]|uniref:AEC family transporter n=1 Tax=Pararhodobacter zhoushanensis TaxID=2479545 RepID=A0ABT3GVK0_9RHOB|nr:AEC family transporter [Pararhodobacter zhoushanensis]MCW1931564.1 AEC family transporter [Pararhodobacter zhoushanensis]
MLAVFSQTLPFFAVIGLGYGAGRSGFFPPEATAWLTKFVFYFALSALLLGFSASMSIGDIFDPRAAAAYLWGCGVVYLIALAVAFIRLRPLPEAVMEAQTAIIGNTGFLGVPMLVLLLGPEAAGTVLLVLSIDLIVFSSLLTVVITLGREGRVSPALPRIILIGLAKNPMVVAMAAGLLWSATGFPLPGPIAATTALLGAAATPGALFAIGASLTGKRAERLTVAGWLSFAKLVLHPAAVGFAALWIFHVDPFAAGVLISAAALPVAGNVYILAQHYGVAVARVSASILISTALSVLTVPLVIAQFTG